MGRASPLLLATVLSIALGCGGAGEEEYLRETDPGLREEHYWAVVGRGECGGEGVLVVGAPRPADERCDARRLGSLAVCWDGEALVHPGAPAEARCLFVAGPPGACREGPGAGQVWECVRTDAE